jgi:urocanate hydratase
LVCASGKPEDLKNRYHRLPSARRNGKAPIEIQQQMQDNIQWIKGAQENK